jgi:hypothetical protein
VCGGVNKNFHVTICFLDEAKNVRLKKPQPFFYYSSHTDVRGDYLTSFPLPNLALTIAQSPTQNKEKKFHAASRRRDV